MYGQKFTVQTDSSGVWSIISKPNATGQLTRWGLAFQEFDLDIKHRKGHNNGNADGLSRAPSVQLDENIYELKGISFCGI